MKYIGGLTLKQDSTGTRPRNSRISRSRTSDPDLKPQDIMLDQGAHLHSSFGLAHSSADDDLSLTGPGEGTPVYMSPEQIEGRRVDHRSELYSLGIIFFANGHRGAPVLGQHGRRALQEASDAFPPSPAVLRPGIPSEIESMILSLPEK